MSISDELERLETLRQSGTLTQEEFQRAKERVLSAPPVESSQQLEEIKTQNAIAQLDREWELERENYMMTGRYGNRYLPKTESSIAGGIILVGFGTFWTLMTLSTGAPIFFPIFGVVFVGIGVVNCITGIRKAGQYQFAERRYRERRHRLLGGTDAPSPFG
jgi:hypothetical protein